jgi:hypothetical protein
MERRQLLTAIPADLSGIAGRPEFASHRPAETID